MQKHYVISIINNLHQGQTNPRHQVVTTPRYFAVVPRFCEAVVVNFVFYSLKILLQKSLFSIILKCVIILQQLVGGCSMFIKGEPMTGC
jgi:preprotein translocase subunit SecY